MARALSVATNRFEGCRRANRCRFCLSDEFYEELQGRPAWRLINPPPKGGGIDHHSCRGQLAINKPTN
jgi:hypothetical protein